MKGFKIRRLKNRRIWQPVQLIMLFALNSENSKLISVVWKSRGCTLKAKERCCSLTQRAASLLGRLYVRVNTNRIAHAAVFWPNTPPNQVILNSFSNCGKCPWKLSTGSKFTTKVTEGEEQGLLFFSSSVLLNAAVWFGCRTLIILCLFNQTHL